MFCCAAATRRHGVTRCSLSFTAHILASHTAFNVCIRAKLPGDVKRGCVIVTWATAAQRAVLCAAWWSRAKQHALRMDEIINQSIYQSIQVIESKSVTSRTPLERFFFLPLLHHHPHHHLKHPLSPGSLSRKSELL